MATTIVTGPERLTLRPASEGGFTVWTDARYDISRDATTGGDLLFAGTLSDALGYMRARYDGVPKAEVMPSVSGRFGHVVSEDWRST